MDCCRLILKDIPKESFHPDYEPMIVSTEEVLSEAIPGVEVTLCVQLGYWALKYD